MRTFVLVLICLLISKTLADLSNNQLLVREKRQTGIKKFRIFFYLQIRYLSLILKLAILH